MFNCILIGITFHHPIGDFGNYYYGSKFFKEGIDPLKFYQSIHFFNVAIRPYENNVFFENYTPVPPFSLIFYWPFTFLSLPIAKLIFNLLGLFIFCFSLQRLIKKLQVFNWSFYLLPFIFFQPLYSNFHHGQTYLLITALLFELYIAWKSDKKTTIGIIIALLFALKIFPAFITIVFLFKKDWKTIGRVIFFTIIVQLLVWLFVGTAVMHYYYFDIFPRLAMNDITEPFSHFNQSFHTFLLNCFVFQSNLNPLPLIHAPLIAVVLQVVFYSFVVSVFISMVLKQNLFLAFFTSILVLALINKYATVYGLLVFFPFIFLVKELSPKKMLLVCVLLFFACNIPVHKLGNLPVVFQYPRVWLLIAVFILLIPKFKTVFNLKYFGICTVFFVLPSLVFYKYNTDDILELRPAKGIVYDFEVDSTHIRSFTCMGNRDTVEVFNFKADKIDSSTFRSGNVLNHKAVLINKSNLLVMTDDNRGVGMYYLKLIKPTTAN